jgi:hypothetical protein
LRKLEKGIGQMDKKMYIPFVGLLLILLTACNKGDAKPAKAYEPTQTAITTPTPQQVTATMTTTVTPDQVLDTETDDGAAVIVRYYTLLDQGRYEEAYELLTADRGYETVQDYVKLAEHSFKTVQIITVEPYGKWLKEMGYSRHEIKTPGRYHVEIIAEGEGGMSGSIPNGQLQSFFVTVRQEENEWKIHSFSTAPPPY